MNLRPAPIAFVVLTLSLSSTNAQAPPRGSGWMPVTGSVRVIDADTLEVDVDGRRVGVAVAGIIAPQGNTACGREAIEATQMLVANGIDVRRLRSALREWSERRDSNPRPPVPQTGALTGLRYAPNGADYREAVMVVQPWPRTLPARQYAAFCAAIGGPRSALKLAADSPHTMPSSRKKCRQWSVSMIMPSAISPIRPASAVIR